MTASTPPPLLRAPPFPGADPSVTWSGPTARTVDHDPATLFAQIRDARVGGAFWAKPARLGGTVDVIVRPGGVAHIGAVAEALTPAERQGALWIAPEGADTRLIRAFRRRAAIAGGQWHRGDVDPWSVLDTSGLDTSGSNRARRLVGHGDDEWVALARIAGLPVTLLSAGRFGMPGDAMATLDAHVARALLTPAYRDPFTERETTIDAVIELLAGWRPMLETNRTIAAASGMAWWKRAEIRQFLWSPDRRLRMVSSPASALRLARKHGGALAIWPSRVSPTLIADAARMGVPLVRVEDGFVRSVGLGVDLVPPSSVMADRLGIHFDPSGPSDLEAILSTTQFSPRLIERARALRTTIVNAGISKYAAGAAAPVPERQAGRKLVLVPGQVEDDMSVMAGGGGIRSNLELLRRARACEPDAEIWFRPHPDVDAGHRVGAVPDAEALTLADRIARGPGMAALLDTVDAVHVLTSLTGFEALLRGREVTCHGTPFYAGWGLTHDLGAIPDRRGRTLSLDELAAGVLILYPRYLDPVTGLPCPPEVLVSRMAGQQVPTRRGWIAPIRRWQGRLMAKWR